MTADFDGGRIDLAKEADFRLGGIEVRPSTRQVESDGSAETLEPRIMQVLVALARRRGQVVSRDQLVEMCWEGRIVGNDALNRCIYRIRKLGEARGDFELETIPRVGYRLWAEQTSPPADIAASLDCEAAGDGSQPEDRTELGHAGQQPITGAKSQLWRFLPGLIAVGVAVVATGLFLLLRAPAPAAPPSHRVAFFGFTAADDNPDSVRIAADATDETFAEFTRAHLDASAKADTLGVPADQRLAKAVALGAAYALSGEVRTDGDEARVNFRLEDPVSRSMLWEIKQTSPLGRPFYSPATYAAYRAARNIDCVITVRGELSRESADSVRAAMSYCSNLADMEVAVSAARRLAELEPHSVFFQALFAYQLMTFAGGLSPDLVTERIQEASVLIAEALKKAPNDPYVVAVAEFVRSARDLSPLQSAQLLESARPGGSAWGQWFLQFRRGLQLLGNGRTAEGVARLNVAEAARPAFLGTFRAYGLASMGKAADAERLFEQIFARAPDYPRLWSQWIATAILEDVGDAEAIIAAAPEDVQPTVVACRRSVLATKQAGALKIPPSCPPLMGVAAASGQVDEAFNLYRASAGPLAPDTRMLLFARSARQMRADARFLPLVKELGLWEYWIATDSRPDVCNLSAEKDFEVCVALRDAQAPQR